MTSFTAEVPQLARNRSMLDHPRNAARDFDLAGFIAAIDGIPVVDNPGEVRLKSKDYSWFSPILKDILRDKNADVVVCPRNEEDVLRIAPVPATTARQHR
jgi:hypothetical protein